MTVYIDDCALNPRKCIKNSIRGVDGSSVYLENPIKLKVLFYTCSFYTHFITELSNMRYYMNFIM